jgi:hypothetical protein
MDEEGEAQHGGRFSLIYRNIDKHGFIRYRRSHGRFF